jgi:hypothetical protein
MSASFAQYSAMLIKRCASLTSGSSPDLGDVRCWVNSGKHLLSLSFSGFDPTQTLRRHSAGDTPVETSQLLIAVLEA